MSKGKPNKRYTPEFKVKVVETMHKEELSIERCGRKSTGRPPKLKKEVEEDLIAEVQRLRAENDYLKKLNALVAERVRQEKKHK